MDTDYEYESIEHGNAKPQSSMAALEQYEAYLRQELPHSVRNELENRLDNILADAEADLRTQLRDIVRDLQIAHFQDYLQQQGLRTGIDSGQPPSLQIAATTDDSPSAPSNAIQPAQSAQDTVTEFPTGYTTDAQTSTVWLPGFDGTIFEFSSELASDSGFFSFSTDVADFVKLNRNAWDNLDLGDEEPEG